MAVTEQRTLFNPQIESLAEQYAKSMGQRAADPFTKADITAMAPRVADQEDLQKRLAGDVTAGLGAYKPYVQAAGQAGQAAGTTLTEAGQQLGTAQTGLGAIGQTYADPAVAGIQQAQGTLGQVSPYIQAAGTGLAGAGQTLGQAGTELTGAGAGLGTAGTELTGAGTAMAGVSPYIGQAAGLTGPMTGQQLTDYMSPYQQQVIDTSLAEFDKQAAMRQQGISDAAVAMGGFGGGREGVMQSEYMAQSDRDRTMLEAQLRNQGYSQAQAARQADLASRLGIGGAQQQYAQGLAGMAGQRAGLAGQAGQFAGARAGLAGQEAGFAQGQLGLGAAQQSLAGAQLGAGQAYLAPGQMMAGVAGQQAGTAGQRAQLGQAQLGLGQFELGTGQAEQGMLGRDVGLAGQVGAMDQAYEQALIDADREKARMGLYEPMERLGFLGSGLTGLMGGMGPQYQFANQPNANPLAQALGIGLGGAKVYKDLM
jgi:hypothetical protein